jgi:hypothetical protein
MLNGWEPSHKEWTAQRQLQGNGERPSFRLVSDLLRRYKRSPAKLGRFARFATSAGTAMRTRPRSKFVKQLKARRCGKCGSKINNQRVRCPRCANALSRPSK